MTQIGEGVAIDTTRPGDEENEEEQEEQKCCCCVTSIAIQNISKIDTAAHMGHSFDTAMGLSYAQSDAGGGANAGCTLEWWEKTNVPAIAGHVPNVWMDMFTLMGGASFGTWSARREPCPGSETVTDTDPPALGRRPGRTVTRTLEFKVIIKSGAGGCSCGTTSLQVTATQVLVMVNGNPDWPQSSFSTP